MAIRKRGKKQTIVIKGTVYSQGITDVEILCTETTCSYSSDNWKGTVISSYTDFPQGEHSTWIANTTWKPIKEWEK